MAAKNKTRYLAADEILMKRAPDFYGVGVLASRTSSRFRTFYKALTAITLLNQSTELWVQRFNADESPYIASELLHSKITVPRLVKVGEEEPRRVNDLVSLTTAYRENKSRVLLGLRRVDDAAAHVVATLNGWAEERPFVADIERDSAEICFEQLLFGIHGRTLAEQVAYIAIKRQAKLDIIGADKVA